MVMFNVSREVSANVRTRLGIRRRMAVSGITLDADLSTYLGALTTPLSEAQQLLLNTFVTDLKTGLSITNLSDAFDVMYVLANETAEAGLKNLVKRSHDADAVNSPTFVALEGFTGDASTSYLNTNFNLSSNSSAYKLNDAHIGAYIRTETTINSNWDAGAYSALAGRSKNLISARYGVDRALGTINALTSSTLLDYDPTGYVGWLLCNRESESSMQQYLNANQEASVDTASNDLVSLNMFMLANNLDGNSHRHCNRQMSIFTMGKSFNSDERVVVKNVLEAYMDANGKGIIA